MHRIPNYLPNKERFEVLFECALKKEEQQIMKIYSNEIFKLFHEIKIKQIKIN